MKKLLVFLLGGIFLVINLTGCSQQEREPETKENSELVGMFTIAFASFIDLDKGLNGGMKYIAIDFSPLEDITAEEKNNILKYLEKNNVPVLEASLEELKNQEGMYNENTRSLEGILLKITEVEKKGDKVTIKGSKYRSGKGAIGVECSLIKETETWEIKEAKITWIS